MIVSKPDEKGTMHILISNDDGLDATGIRHLAEQIGEQADRVTIIAPDRDRSGASNSLTLDRPIRNYRAKLGKVNKISYAPMTW